MNLMFRRKVFSMDSRIVNVTHAVVNRANFRTRYGERGRNPYDALRPMSALTHGVGAILAVLGTLILLFHAHGVRAVLACAIYGASMILLYCASTAYHSLNVGMRARIIFRKLDHASICLLIAGTYTPICLLALRGAGATVLLVSIWVLALGGIALSIFWITAPRWLSTVLYLCMGWLALFAIRPVSLALNSGEMFWLLAGGILYSVGGGMYALKWPYRDHPHFGFHEIFHLFVLLGSICHYFLIYQIVA